MFVKLSIMLARCLKYLCLASKRVVDERSESAQKGELPLFPCHVYILYLNLL